jgi:hypothetical protein
MKVFGVGLNKTGTTSLAAGLRRLGFRHFFKPLALLKAWREGDAQTVFEAVEAHDSFEDWPFPLMAGTLLERYGDQARFVLTERSSPQAWLESLKAHALTTPPEHARRLAFGVEYPHTHEDRLTQIYARHSDHVRELFRARGAEDRLLVLNWAEEGSWERLCAFLERDPLGVTPHRNRAEDFLDSPHRAWNEARLAALKADPSLDQPAFPAAQIYDTEVFRAPSPNL